MKIVASSELLNQIINILRSNFQPNSMVMDFEQAFIKSLTGLYINSRIFFLFYSCLW